MCLIKKKLTVFNQSLNNKYFLLVNNVSCADSDMLPSPMWSSVNLFPLNAEVPMTPSVPIAIDESGFSISPVSSGNDEVHSSEALKMKPDPMSTLDAVASVQVDGNCNAVSKTYDS